MWVCVPLAVETNGNWGKEARGKGFLLATRLTIGSSKSKSVRVARSLVDYLLCTFIHHYFTIRSILVNNFGRYCVMTYVYE